MHQTTNLKLQGEENVSIEINYKTWWRLFHIYTKVREKRQRSKETSSLASPRVQQLTFMQSFGAIILIFPRLHHQLNTRKWPHSHGRPDDKDLTRQERAAIRNVWRLEASLLEMWCCNPWSTEVNACVLGALLTLGCRASLAGHNMWSECMRLHRTTLDVGCVQGFWSLWLSMVNIGRYYP